MFEVTEIGSAMGTWSVVAEIHTSDGTLFMGERYKDTPGVGVGYCLVYVVAFMPLTSASGEYGEWVSGHYFDGDVTKDNRQAAKGHFLSRAADSMWS